MISVGNVGGTKIAFRYRNIASGKCLDIEAPGSGRRLVTRPCVPTKFSQHWVRDFAQNTTFLTTVNRSSFLAMSVRDRSKLNDASIVQESNSVACTRSGASSASEIDGCPAVRRPGLRPTLRVHGRRPAHRADVGRRPSDPDRVPLRAADRGPGRGGGHGDAAGDDFEAPDAGASSSGDAQPGGFSAGDFVEFRDVNGCVGARRAAERRRGPRGSRLGGALFAAVRDPGGYVERPDRTGRGARRRLALRDDSMIAAVSDRGDAVLAWADARSTREGSRAPVGSRDAPRRAVREADPARLDRCRRTARSRRDGDGRGLGAVDRGPRRARRGDDAGHGGARAARRRPAQLGVRPGPPGRARGRAGRRAPSWRSRPRRPRRRSSEPPGGRSARR